LSATLDVTFWNRALSLASQEWNLPRRKKVGTDPADPWVHVMDIYHKAVGKQQPPSADILDNTMTRATQPLAYIANGMLTNFKTYLQMTLRDRLQRWISLQLLLPLQPITNEPVKANYLKSVTTCILHTIAEHTKQKDEEDLHTTFGKISSKYGNVIKFVEQYNKDVVLQVLQKAKNLVNTYGIDPKHIGFSKFQLSTHNIHAALHLLHTILLDFENIQTQNHAELSKLQLKCKHIARLFVLVPTRSPRPVTIYVDTTTLKSWHEIFSGTKHSSEESIWNQYFTPPKKGSKSIFDNAITSNGVSMNIQYRTPSTRFEVDKQLDTKCEERGKLKKSLPTVNIMDPQSASRIVAIDPGRKFIVVGAVFNQKAWNDLKNCKDPDRNKFEILKVKNSSYALDSGGKLHTKRTTQWLQSYAKSTADTVISNHIANAVDKIPSKKTANMKSFLVATKYDSTLLSHKIIENVYGQRKFLKLDHHMFMRKKQAIEKIVDKITESKNHAIGKNHCVVAHGNGGYKCSCAAGSGMIGSPRDMLLKRLHERCKAVLLIDEHKTSQLCPYCATQLTKHSDRVLLCSHSTLRSAQDVSTSQQRLCRLDRYFDRDVVGSINIMKTAFHDHHPVMQPYMGGLLPTTSSSSSKRKLTASEFPSKQVKQKLM
jgi:transposase